MIIITIYTNDKLDIKMKGILKSKKQDNSYNYIIDTNIINISDFINHISKKVNIKNIEIENESIDNMIVKLYKEYQI